MLPELVRAGGSPMGARPKVMAGVRADFGHVVTGATDLPAGYSHWLIKFAASENPTDAGPIEHAYVAMARAAGIRFPRTHLFEVRAGHRYFGVERFDRDPSNPTRRMHVHTLAGLLHYDHRLPSQDYADLLKVAWRLTEDRQEVIEAFRRMAYHTCVRCHLQLGNAG